MSNRLKWIAVPLAGFAVVPVVLFLGIAVLSLLDSLCPPEDMISGTCTAPWYFPVSLTLMILGAIAATAGFVIVPAWVAPSHKYRVALIAFGVGGAIMLPAAVGKMGWLIVIIPALIGARALWFVASKWGQHEVAGTVRQDTLK